MDTPYTQFTKNYDELQELASHRRKAELATHTPLGNCSIRLANIREAFDVAVTTNNLRYLHEAEKLGFNELAKLAVLLDEQTAHARSAVQA